MVEWKPVALQLKVPLAGPYERVLPRPAPEVDALGSGECMALIRASRIMEPMPLLPSHRACYYTRQTKAGQTGFSARDFAAEYGKTADTRYMRYLAVPAYHIRLPSSAPVGEIAEALTPWKAIPIERWRKGLSRAIWVSLMRVYRFKPQPAPQAGPNPLNPKVEPTVLKAIEPVLDDAAFEARLQEALELIGKHLRGERAINVRKAAEETAGTPLTEPINDYSVANWARDCHYPAERLQEWERMARRKKVLVFYGPPGTGKTFNAMGLARRLAGSGGIERTVQFHPTYAYEDFVQGIRPVYAGKGGYELSEGLFLRFCRQARACQPHPAVLVVDELNRADAVRVFGELLFGLEYRGRPVELAGGGTFRVPDNVVILATMNTADRSIAALDRALRRRGTFVRLKPEYSVLRAYFARHGINPQPLVDTLRRVNRAIDDADARVGHSFFMQDGPRIKETLADVWLGEIEPLLEETLYEQPQLADEFSWETLRKGELGQWANP